MKFYFILLIILFTSLISACSNRAIYDGFQYSNRNDCTKLLQTQYEECMQRADMSFHEYETERKEALEK